MTVIAFDGKLLVADLQMGGSPPMVHSKIRKYEVGTTTYYTAITGNACVSDELIKWFLANEKLASQGLDLIPHPWHHHDNPPAELYVWEVRNGVFERMRAFDNTAEGLTYHHANRKVAFGSGFRFATAAMACDRNAIGAVKATILNDHTCGLGYEGYDIETGEHFIVGARIVFDEPQPEQTNGA